MIRELDRVVLTTPRSELGLVAGDIGTVVLVHEGGKGFEVEFLTLGGDTFAVTTLTAGDVPGGQERDRACPDRRCGVSRSGPTGGDVEGSR